MGFFDSLKKKSAGELRLEIAQLKAKQAGIAISPKDEYKALLKERNELKWGKLRATARKAWQSVGKVADAHNEVGLDSGASKKKESSSKPVKASKPVLAVTPEDDFTMDYGFGAARDPSKPLKGESKTVQQGAFWNGSLK